MSSNLFGIPRQMAGELAKFAIVVGLGLGIDTGLGWLLVTVGGFGIVLAGVCGFLAGALFNYSLHELWTFAGDKTSLSVARAGKMLAALAIVFLVRVVSLAVLAVIFPRGSLVIVPLFLASGLSFVVNFLITRFVVFDRRAAGQIGAT